MLDREIDVEGDQDAPPKRGGVEQRRVVETVRVEERLDDPDQLRRRKLVGAGEPMAQLCKRLPRGLEREALQTEALRQLLEVDRGEIPHVRRTDERWCPSCAAAMERVVAEAAGLKGAKVSFATSAALVT